MLLLSNVKNIGRYFQISMAFSQFITEKFEVKLAIEIKLCTAFCDGQN